MRWLRKRKLRRTNHPAVAERLLDILNFAVALVGDFGRKERLDRRVALVVESELETLDAATRTSLLEPARSDAFEVMRQVAPFRVLLIAEEVVADGVGGMNGLERDKRRLRVVRVAVAQRRGLVRSPASKSVRGAAAPSPALSIHVRKTQADAQDEHDCATIGILVDEGVARVVLLEGPVVGIDTGLGELWETNVSCFFPQSARRGVDRVRRGERTLTNWPDSFG